MNRIKPGGFADGSNGAIKSGMIIVSIDGFKVQGISQNVLGELIIGQEGSTVMLELTTDALSPPFTVNAVRMKGK